MVESNPGAPQGDLARWSEYDGLAGAWRIPSEFQANRYGSVYHGVSLCDEYPSVKHWSDWAARGFDGHLEAGMVICVESYIGPETGGEGVKMEDQDLVTGDGAEALTTYTTALV